MTPIIRTIRGDVQPDQIGPTLFHEHVWSDMTPWIADEDLRLTDAALAADELRLAKGEGLSCVVDATTPDVGGDRAGLMQAALRSGVHVVAGAGFYRQISFPPDIDAFSDDALTARFIAEVAVPDAATGTRAGVYGEVGSSKGGMTRTEERVLRCVANAQMATGASIITHTAEGDDALRQLDLLESTGVSTDRIAIGHLDCTPDDALRREVASRGAWVGIDRIGLERYATDEARVRAIVSLLNAGHGDRILLSGDLARRSRLRRQGGPGYANVLLQFLPRLSAAGVGRQLLHELMVENPRRFLAFEPSGVAV